MVSLPVPALVPVCPAVAAPAVSPLAVPLWLCPEVPGFCEVPVVSGVWVDGDVVAEELDDWPEGEVVLWLEVCPEVELDDVEFAVP